MFCNNCGAEIDDKAVVCPKCGCPVTDPNDESSTGFFVLGMLFPLIGFILWLVFKDKSPLKAASAGKGAITGIIIEAILTIVSIFAGSCFITDLLGSMYYY